MASKHLLDFSVLTRLPLLLLAACAQLAGIGSASDPAEPAIGPENPTGPVPPHMSDQDGSTPVDAGPTEPLPPSKTSCAANLDSDPENCGYCTHRCFPGNACTGGVCDSTVVATATTIDSVALAPAGAVLLGDATNGKIRLCPRTGPSEACQVVQSGTGIGSSLGVVAAHFAYYDRQAGHVMGCALLGCTVDARDLGTVDVGTSSAPAFAADGTWALWSTPAALITSPVITGDPLHSQTDTRFTKTSRIAALYMNDDSTTVAGATPTGAWVLRLQDSNTALIDGKKRSITSTAANDVAVDTMFVWSAQSDGLFRAPHSTDNATKAHDGACTAVASSLGVAFVVTGGNVLRVQAGAPDITLATNATRVFADDTDGFVYFTRGNELRRVPR